MNNTDLEALAAGAIRDCPLTTDDLIVVMWDGDETHADRKRARAVLAAVLPVYEKQLRAQIADEIRAHRARAQVLGYRPAYKNALDFTERLVRGDTDE